MSNIFSEEEKKFIIDNYATMDTDEIAKKLNKTYYQIRSFANSKEIYKTTRKGSLNKSEKDFLIKNYKDMSIDDIVKVLNIDRDKVKRTANRMGLKQKDIYFTEDEKKFIIDNYASIGSDKISQIINKDRDKINTFAHTKRLTLNKKYIDDTKVIDLTGQTFNQLKIISFDYKRREEEKIKVKNGEKNQVSTYWLCECSCGNPELISVEGYALTHGKTKSCGCTRYVNSIIASQKRFKKSFYDWCIENNAQIYLNLWDYKLNDKNPKEIAYSSNQKIYFKCPNKLHESEQFSPRQFTKHNNVEYKYRCTRCNSIAQWGIDNICLDFLEKYWDFEKNAVNPWVVGYGSTRKVWFKCNNADKSYHESYEGRIDGFKAGNRCPYCNNIKIHKLDSLGTIYPEVLKIWSGKNKKSPYEIAPRARAKYWFKCEKEIHEDYLKAIYSGVESNFQCPECNVSKGEKRVSEFLIKFNIKYTPQKEFNDLIGVNGGNLKFDFYLEHNNIKYTIEYDGIGHYEVIDFHGKGKENATKEYEKLKIHDKLKDNYCIKNNIKMIRIPYWDFDNIEEISQKELNIV